jgi:hypothetical protein
MKHLLRTTLRRLTTVINVIAVFALAFSGLGAHAGIVSSFSDVMTSASSSAQSSHAFQFVTPTGVDSPTDTVMITFSSGFSLATLSAPNDYDFAVGSTGNCATAIFTDKVVAGSPAAGAWGVAKSGQAITFTAPTDAGPGEIAAGVCVEIQVGTNATFGATGTHQIGNPGTVGSKTIWVSGTFADSGSLAVAILSPGQVSVGATVTGGTPPPISGGGGSPPPPPPPDTIAPIISNIQVPVLGTTNATVTWDTNELANSFVDYGLTNTYEIGTMTDPTSVFAHTVPLGGLLPGTLYHFRVRSADASGNEAQSTDRTFTTVVVPDTTAPVISGINVTNLTGVSASIGWTTNENADSRVDFGLANTYGQNVVDPTATLTHLLNLTGLTPNTTYHYQVTSKDAATNVATSVDLTFTTLDTIAPNISGLTAINITFTSASVVWQTDKSTTGLLEYGLTNTYGSTATTLSGTSHSVPLAGLTYGTTYQYRVTATDASGNTAQQTGSFMTLVDSQPPASVSALLVTPGNAQNSLSWVNPPDADFDVVYVLRKTSGSPAGPADGTIVYQGGANSFLDTGLTNGTKYYYAVFSHDVHGNFGAGALGDGTPMAPVIPPVCGNGICEASETNASCPADCAPPVFPTCGDNICNGAETNDICPADCPLVTPEPPPVTPPVIPPVVVPKRDLNTFGPTDIGVTIVNKHITIQPSADGSYEVLSGSEALIAVYDRFIAGDVESSILTLGNQTYRMYKGGSYDALVMLPNITGKLVGNVHMTYMDGNWDDASFTLNLVGMGTVYETVNGAQAGIADTKITLYSYDGGKHEVDSMPTDGNGKFAFVVVPGTYSVKAERTGYGMKETGSAKVDAVVHPTIELIKIKPISEVLQTTAPLPEKVSAVVDQVQIEINTIRDNVIVQQTTQVVVAPTATTIAVVNAVTVMSVGAVANAGAWFQYLFLQPLLWFSRRKRKGWGIVYDSLTKLPIDLAVVRLVDAGTGRLLQSRVTDRAGRYFFIIEPGKYRLMVVKPGYTFPTEYLKHDTEDVKFTELYHSEEIVVTELGKTLAANIPLDPVGRAMVPTKRIIFQAAMQKFQIALSVGSVLAGIVAAYLNPTTFTIGLLILQIVLFVVFRIIAEGKRPSGWGIVYDEKTKAPLANAVVRIFEPKYNKLLDTYVTDAKGRYAFIVGPSVYYTTYEHAGYQSERKNGLDYTKSEESAVVSIDVSMKTPNP